MEQEKVLEVLGRSQSAAVFTALMRKVYLWMTLGLAMTGLAAAYVAGNAGLMQAIFGSRLTFWALIIAELGVVFYFSARIMRMSFATAGVLFAVYALLNGVTLSVLLLVYDLGTIQTAFFVTAGTFAAMAVVGTTVKRDLSAIARYGLMILIGIIIASLVNMFMKSEGLNALISYVAVLVFVGLTAYDAQKVRHLAEAEGTGLDRATTNKLGLLCALSLYLDFINLFIYLVQILGRNRE